MRSVNYLGPEGTFSHILARKRFARNALLTPCPTIEAVFERVVASTDGLGIVPIENSSGGGRGRSTRSICSFGMPGASSFMRSWPWTCGLPCWATRGNYFDRVFPLCADQAPRGLAQAAASPGAPCVPWPARPSLPGKASAEQDSRGARLTGSRRGLRPGLAGDAVRSQLDQRHPLFHHRPRRPWTITKREKGRPWLRRCPTFAAASIAFSGPFARQKVNLSRIVSRPVPGHPETRACFFSGDRRQSQDPRGHPHASAGRGSGESMRSREPTRRTGDLNRSLKSQRQLC